MHYYVMWRILQSARYLSIPLLHNKIIIIIIYFRDKQFERFLSLKGRHPRIIIYSLSLYTDYEMDLNR